MKHSVERSQEITKQNSPVRLWLGMSERAQAGYLLALIIIISVGLRLYALDVKGFWGDEIWTAQRSSSSISAIFSDYLDLPGPLYYLAGKIALTFLPMLSTEAALRLPSALVGIATIPMVYLLGKRMAGTSIGLLGALLVAISPYQVWYAQEARFYTFTVFLSLAATLALLHALEHPEARWAWAIWTLSSCASLYNQPLPAALVIGAHALFGGLRLLRARNKQLLLLRALTAGTAIILLYIPVIVRIINGRLTKTTDQSASWYFDRAGRGLVLGPAFEKIPGQISLIGSSLVTHFTVPGWGRWIFLALALIAVADLIRRNEKDLPLMILSHLIVIVLIFVGLQPANGFVIRYVLFLQPLYLLLVASGVVLLGRAVRTYGHWPQPALTGGVVAILSSLSLITVWDGYRQVKPIDWRALSAYIQEVVRPGDTIMGNGYTTETLGWYYTPTNNVTMTSGHLKAAELCAAGGVPTWLLYLAKPADQKMIEPWVRTTPITEAAWTPAGMNNPHFTYTESFFPDSEWHVVLYPFIPPVGSRITFCHISNVPWSDRSYQHIPLGTEMSFALALSSSKPRTIEVTTFDLPGHAVEVVVNNIVLGRIDTGSGWWRAAQFPVPSEAGDQIQVTLRAIGALEGGVSTAALSYAEP